MQRDRFLTAIFIGIGALILTALVLFFLRQGKTTYQDDSTPTGVVSNYILALQRRDYQRAYAYLADAPGKPTFIKFQEPFLQYQASELASTPVEVGKMVSDEQSQTALVPVTLVRGGRGFLEEPYRDSQTAQLVKQEGAWKITSFPYPYWSYDWSISLTPEGKPAP
jgi:hypothetical protein